MLARTFVTILFLASLDLYSQDRQYTEALILTRTGDTLECYVPVDLAEPGWIYWKRTPESKPASLKADEIRTIVTMARILESVTVGNRTELMTRRVSGKINVYNSISVRSTPGPYQGQVGETIATICTIRKEGRDYRIRKITFQDDIAEVINDCPALLQKVSSKEYKFADIETIATEYNEGCVDQ